MCMVCVHLYMHVHTCAKAHVYAGTHTCVSICVWRAEVDDECLSQLFADLFIETGSIAELEVH